MNAIQNSFIGAGIITLISIASPAEPEKPLSVPKENNIETKQIIKKDTITNSYEEKKVVNEEIKVNKYIPIKQKIQTTKPVQKNNINNCHPSYGGCLKRNAGDYDCMGGSGNGPNYTGLIKVIGYDEFGLDRDKDGWGCE